MILFDFNKKINYLLIFISLLGVFSFLMPWITYPRLEMTLKGYDGDGVLLAIIFFLILGINLYSAFRNNSNKKRIINIFSFVLAAIIFTLSVYKIYAFYEDVFSFQSNDPITSYAGAGVQLRYGLYVIATLSFICMFLSSLGSFFTKPKRLIFLLALFLISGGISYKVYNANSKIDRLDKIAIEENLNGAFEKMGNALVTKQSDQFVEYIHPILYQSIGGKKKLAELMSSMYQDVEVKEAKIIKVFKTKTEGDAIQALLMQSFTFFKNGSESNTTNKSFAFSYDGGRTWSFAGIEDRTFDEMKKILPEIFNELRYD